MAGPGLERCVGGLRTRTIAPAQRAAMATMENPAWYHGDISRDEAESRLRAAAQQYAAGQSIFLVRKSKSRAKDFVISSIISGNPQVRNLIVEVEVGMGQTTYRCDIPTQADQLRFTSLQDLLDHYRNPTSNFPGGPLNLFVSAPNARIAPAVAPAPPMAAAPEPAAAPAPAPLPAEDEDEILLCEGYLNKLRGIGQTRRRYFRLTNKRFAYFTEDAGELISMVLSDQIEAVADVDKTKIRVVTVSPMGTSSSNEVLLEAGNAKIKNRWMQAFKQKENLSGGIREQEGDNVLVEGYLVKVQSGVSSNKTRWFCLTDQTFAYYREECGELMGSVPVDKITTLSAPGDSRDFKIIANERFTVTGSFEVTCRCETKAVRNKWLVQLQRILPEEKIQKY
eukprot:m.288312 g.288312  ORF g.288312 m.288312 type:complete len:395 (+) comp11947_c0_seq1:115-1299(+)